jgi:hypothetical protein
MDTITDALIACVKAIPGGSKTVGPKLWPEKTPEAAQRLLLDCLNDDRPQKLAPEQVEFVFRIARERGCHAGMQYLAAALSYAEPTPIEPKDEADQLRRRLLEMGRELQAGLAKLEQIERLGPRAVGA